MTATETETRLRAALRRFAETFRERHRVHGEECGVCGEAWGEQGYEHAQGCCVGDALTDAADGEVTP